jgi:hypothetical protein
MMETMITRLVDNGIAATVARALEDFQGMVVTITIKEVPAKTPKPPKEPLSVTQSSPSKKEGLTHEG